MNKIKNIVSVVVFACILFSISGVCLLKEDTAFSASERRELSSSPELSIETIKSGDFMSSFEEYTADQFPFRDELRSLKAGFSMFVLGRLDSNGLFIKDGHISKLDDKELDSMKDYAAEKFNFVYNSYIKGKNSKLYFSLIPDKNYLLAEPNGYPSVNYRGMAEDMQKRLSYMEYIDIYPLLDLEDYYNTDSHWRQEKITDIARYIGNKMGTGVAADYKVNTLNIPFDGVFKGQLGLPFKSDTIKYLTNDNLDKAIVKYNDTGIPKEGPMYDMDKARGKDPYEMFLGGTKPLITIENPNARTQKELIMLRDSFGSSLAPLFAEGYRKVTVVDIRYIQSSFLGNLVDFDNSDVLFIYSTGLINNSTALQ